MYNGPLFLPFTVPNLACARAFRPSIASDLQFDLSCFTSNTNPQEAIVPDCIDVDILSSGSSRSIARRRNTSNISTAPSPGAQDQIDNMVHAFPVLHLRKDGRSSFAVAGT
jgi:hypothetical protein